MGVNYLFSPNFTYMLDFSQRLGQFQIKKTETMHVYLSIPNDLLSIEYDGMQGMASIKMILSRMRWEGEDLLRIVNTSSMDCIFQMATTDPEDQDPD